MAARGAVIPSHARPAELPLNVGSHMGDEDDAGAASSHPLTSQQHSASPNAAQDGGAGIKGGSVSGRHVILMATGAQALDSQRLSPHGAGLRVD